MSAAEFDWKKKNFLVMHWGDSVRHWFVSCLRKRNPGLVVAATKLEEVPVLMRQFRLDALLLELPPQDVNCLKFLRALRHGKTSPNQALPVFALLQTDNHPLIAKACEYGLTGVLSLPLSEKAVIEAVATGLSRGGFITWTKGYLPPEREGGAFVPPSGKTTAAKIVGPRQARGGALPTTAPAKRAAAGGGVETIEAPAAAKRRDYDLTDEVPPDAVTEDDNGIELAKRRKKKKSEALETAIPDPEKRTVGTYGDEELPLAEAPHREDLGDLPDHVRQAIEAHKTWVVSAGRDGKRGSLRGADLAGLDLSNLQLSGMDLREADLSDANLAASSLSGADLRYARLESADLSQANLAVARLRHARLRLCRLAEANLRGTDLSGADLRNADLAGADLANAITLSTDLRGTDLSGSEGLSQSQADKLVTDMETRMPFGILRLVETVEDA